MEAKRRYEKVRQQYGAFSDANQELILESVRSSKRKTTLQSLIPIIHSPSSLQDAYAKVQAVTLIFFCKCHCTNTKAGP